MGAAWRRSWVVAESESDQTSSARPPPRMGTSSRRRTCEPNAPLRVTSAVARCWKGRATMDQAVTASLKSPSGPATTADSVTRTNLTDGGEQDPQGGQLLLPRGWTGGGPRVQGALRIGGVPAAGRAVGGGLVDVLE